MAPLHEPRGDSGIYLRGDPQVQIWDSNHLDPKQYPKDYKKGSGGLWNNEKNNVPLKNADKEPGRWNTFHIVMKDGKVTVKPNGELVVDNIALENYFEKDKPLPAKGPIELQQHYRADGKPGKLWFKTSTLARPQSITCTSPKPPTRSCGITHLGTEGLPLGSPSHQRRTASRHVQPALVGQSEAEVVVGRGVFGVEVDGLVVLRDGLVHLALLP